MNPRRFSLDWRNGWLCIREDSTDSYEPKIVSLWWPIAERSKAECLHYDYPVGDVMRPLGTLTFVAEDSRRDMRQYELKDCGKTVTMWRETYDASKPKRVRNVRWYNGEWQVITQTEKYCISPALPDLEPLRQSHAIDMAALLGTPLK